MTRIVIAPPETDSRSDGMKPGGWWHDTDEPGRIICDLCPRECNMKAGDRGFCFVRQNIDGQMVLTTYGRSTGFCVDPIEKKPLNHFLPGTSVLSFGTAGCNLGCKFCQNWDISKSREVERLSEEATPQTIALAAQRLGCRSVAYTYNDPVIWAEYAIDCAKACRDAGVKSVAVTAGYIQPQARAPFFEYMDAANVDLKAFTEEFYHRITYSHLQPVLETLRWLKHDSDVWFEITNLVIPDANDSTDEIRRMCDWILSSVGDEVPVHFTAFHPDFRMTDRPPTPHETLLAAHDLARNQGLKYVYVGNVDDTKRQSTYCPCCGEIVIERNWYELGAYHLNENRCGKCDHSIAGHFETSPGDWGRKRRPVRISEFSDPSRNRAVKRGAENMESSSSAQSDPPVATDGPLSVSEAQERAIHRAACQFVSDEVARKSTRIGDPVLDEVSRLSILGCFVTLKRGGRLRGCCGTVGRPMPLLDALRIAATRTATQDVRLPAVSLTELEFLDLSVSLLFNLQRMAARGRDRVAAVTVGRHGLQIQRGASSGLLLPVVAVEHRLDSEAFLCQVCHKAGLAPDAWMADDTSISTFEGHSISAPFEPGVAQSTDRRPEGLVDTAELVDLSEHCRNNVIALLSGATPSYYLPACSDGTAAGLSLAIMSATGKVLRNFTSLSLRPGVPLQASLFELCERAARSIREGNSGSAMTDGWTLELTVLHDPAMHGTVAEADLRGVDPRHRALLVVDGNTSAWAFDPKKSPTDLMKSVTKIASVARPQLAGVYSLEARSTGAPASATTAAQEQPVESTRLPVVAGKFYPDDADQLGKMVDQLLSTGEKNTSVRPCAAVMVPHAGLRYSGRVAAAVFRHVQIPDRVIVISPKHTRLGAAWAVAPHESWRLPGATLASDPQLARQLSAAIPGLQLDAAAHSQEHGIEVELPFLARLAPRSRVVGVTVGGGTLEDCIRFASGLSNVMRACESQPLLVVSSDMNHFARDEENRRLDEIAIQALETLNPTKVYETVVGQRITMCGVLPAVIVLETLRQLGRLSQSHRVAYTTSAEASGDTSRVVGYAGMVFE